MYNGDDPHPLGQREWTLLEDTCEEGEENTEIRTISFTQCSASQFACEDGTCLDMQLRYLLDLI